MTPRPLPSLRLYNCVMSIEYVYLCVCAFMLLGRVSPVFGNLSDVLSRFCLGESGWRLALVKNFPRFLESCAQMERGLIGL